MAFFPLVQSSWVVFEQQRCLLPLNENTQLLLAHLRDLKIDFAKWCPQQLEVTPLKAVNLHEIPAPPLQSSAVLACLLTL